jgi:hypothetical protein
MARRKANIAKGVTIARTKEASRELVIADAVKVMSEVPAEIPSLERVPFYNSLTGGASGLSTVAGETLLKIIEEYATSTYTISDIVKNHGTSMNTWWKIIGWPIIQDLLQRAREVKADQFVEAADKMYEDDKVFNALALEDSQFGVRISSAGVAYIRDKSNYYARRAGLLNRQRYHDRPVDVNISVNNTSNTNNFGTVGAVSLDDLASLDITELTQVKVDDIPEID